MSRLQKHERDFVALVRGLGARAVEINKNYRHPRITGITADGRHFELTFPCSPGDRNWMHAARRDVLRVLNPQPTDK